MQPCSQTTDQKQTAHPYDWCKARYAILIEGDPTKNFNQDGKPMPQLLLGQKRSIQLKSKNQFTQKIF